MNKFIVKPDESDLAERKRILQAFIEERERQHVTQTEFASRMQIPKQSLSRMEQAVQDPHLFTLQRYASVLHKRLVFQLVDIEDA